ncbi:cytochrome P450 [Podospora conica]|nr:cytochrome P450 [Schizothecium conicum]
MAPKLSAVSRVALATTIQVFVVRHHPGWVPLLPSLVLPALTVLLGCLNFALLLTWNTFIHPFAFHPLRNFPAPKAIIYSRALKRLRTKKPPGQLLLEIAENTPNDGLLVVLGQDPSLALTKPSALADVLVHHPYDFAKFDSVRDFLRPVLGNGLVVVEGEEHKFLRKNAQPAFKFSEIKELYPMMWNKAVAFTNTLRGAVEGDDTNKAIDMNWWASKVTIDIIGLAAFGQDFRVLANFDDPLIRNYDKLLKPGKGKFLYFLLSIMLGRDFVKLLPWKTARTFEQTTANIRSICGQIVSDKRAAIAKTPMDGHLDILSLLIKSDNFSHEELVDQLLTFLAAGHETSSSVFIWATYLLATHPTVRAKLQSELRDALPSFPALPPDTDLASLLTSLPYLNGVLNETLRLYPTVPLTVRVAVRDTTICGHAIAKGTELTISPWLVNRYTENWGPDATSFVPERWINADDGRPNNTGGAASNYANMTFLHGPRSCIGQGFAKAELRCLLAAFARRFEWELGMKEEDVVPGGVITIKPANGLFLVVKVAEG